MMTVGRITQLTTDAGAGQAKLPTRTELLEMLVVEKMQRIKVLEAQVVMACSALREIAEQRIPGHEVAERAAKELWAIEVVANVEVPR